VKSMRTFAVFGTAATAVILILFTAASPAQETAYAAPPAPDNANVRDLELQVRELRTLVDQMRSENAQSRSEMQELRRELQETRQLLAPIVAANGQPSSSTAPAPAQPSAASATPATAVPSETPSALEARVQKLEDSTSLLGAKIDEQYQTKVETASKYRARLSGIVLFNAFRNIGGFDNLDFPDYSMPVGAGTSLATVGATLRQSEVGLEVFGPNVAGAKSSANVRFDFAGGFPSTPNGVNFGIMRLQTASLRLDWEHTSIVGGQDSLFISPLSPTSFASLATPAFAYAGNLWGWIPQLRLEHRFALSSDQTIAVQAGILDNLDWEPPPSTDNFNRFPHAGEQSGQPAYAMRTSWSRLVFGHPLSVGVAGYYGRQNWLSGHYVDGWAGMTDWQIPLLSRLSLSGEFYRGRGIGGLGAGVGRAILLGGTVGPTTPIRGLDSEGGWSQLKLQITPKVELNGVFAQDNPFAGDVRGFAIDANNFSTILGRNRGVLGNVIYRPRSDLLLSAEFRRLRSFPVYSNSSTTNQVNLSMGILF
jgi:hypothetical protein